MRERKQAALRKIRIIRMIGERKTAKHVSESERIKMMLDELRLLEDTVFTYLA